MTSDAPAVVGIDLVKARLLVGALDDAAHRVAQLALVAGAALSASGEDPSLLAPLRTFGAWADARRGSIGAVVATIAAAEEHGTGGLAGLDVWHAPLDPVFAEPRSAVLAAHTAASAAAADDGDRLGELLSRWGNDPVFAGALLSLVGPTAVLDALVRLRDLLGSGLDDDLRRQEAVVTGLAEVVATARRYEMTTLSFDDLARAADERDDLAPGELALLFWGPAVFDPTFLAQAVQRLVLTTVPDAADGGRWTAPTALDGETDRRDSELLALGALARNPTAASTVLAEADLDRLLGRERWRDGGAALAEVLRVGTHPERSSGAARAAATVIEWVAAHTELDEHGALAHVPTLAPLVGDALGAVAAPWIGSFRSDRNDPIEVDPVADRLRWALTGDQSRRYLLVASRSAASQDAIRAAAIEWARVGAERRAADPSALDHLTAIGDVARLVAAADHEGSVARGATLDEVRDRERTQWGLVQTAISVAADPFDPTSAAVSLAGMAAIDHVLPETTFEQEAADAAIWKLPQAQLQVEQVVLDALWRHRAENRVFEQAPPPPAWLFADDRLVLVPEMSGAQLEQYRAWLAALAGSGVAHLDRVGAEFGRDGYVVEDQ